MITEKVHFKNSRSMDLAGIVDREDLSGGKMPAVIICHGFTLFKEFKPLHHLAQTLASNGFASLRFDFSDCRGESGGRCEDMMVSHQVNDLISAVNFLEKLDYIDSGRIGVAGHSLGGFTAIVTATTDKRLKAVVSISSPARAETQNLFNESTEKKWMDDGILNFNTYKKGHVKLHYSFMEDLKEYDGTKIIKEVHVPIRLIHGQNDAIVPVENAEALYKNANQPKELMLIPDADHLFLKEPYMGKMIAASTDWFKRHLP